MSWLSLSICLRQFGRRNMTARRRHLPVPQVPPIRKCFVCSFKTNKEDEAIRHLQKSGHAMAGPAKGGVA